MNDERHIGEGLLSHLHWLVTHPTHTALANGGAVTVLGMTLHAGLDYALFAGALAAAATAAVNLAFRYASPIADAMGKAHAARWTPAPVAPPGPRRVLVVDDEHTLHDMASLLPDVATEHARTAYETLHALARDRGISAVLLDLGLPDVRSVEGFARDVRAAAPPGCVVIVTSGRNDAPATARAIGARCLMKPFSLDDLCAAVGAKP